MDDIIYEALNRYFNILRKLGYKSYSEVDKLLVLIFILELLDNECTKYITDKDYRDIQKTLHCIYGSACLIPYPRQIVNTELKCSVSL